MPDYVYALHNFVPEHEDEIAFEAGQPIEVIEKDDQYNDGWWQGRNIAGKIGLFPQSYTTPAAPPGGVSNSSSASSNDPIITPPDSISPLGEEPESTSLQDADADSRIGIAIGEPDDVDAEVMKATMTDVQKAIEQLGRNDRDGAQSFSFSSTRDGDTDRETDGTETDGEIGEGWHRSARDKLAEQARRVVEAQAAAEAREAQEVSVRTSAPPIDVEMSDESEAEEDDSAFQHLQHMHFTRDHPHIPEEEEEEEARRNSVARDHRRKNSNETSSIILPKDDPSPVEEEAEERTAPANQTSFTSSSPPPRSTRSPILNNRRSPRPLSTPTTPDAIKIVAPVPIVPMGVHMITVAASPEPGVRAPSVTRDIPAALPSPAPTASTRQHSRQVSQPNSVSSGGKCSAMTLAQSAPESEKKSTPPSEWTVDEVVEWLKSKGFGPDVYDKFIEQEITGDVLLELDINLLKAEIGIVAFGKRMRIANAIAELRRPPSIILTDHQLQRAQSVSQSLTYAHSPSGSTQHSLNSPMFASMGSTLNGPPSSTLAGPGSLESPRAETFTSPLISKRVSSLSSAGASVNGGGSVEGASVAAGIERAGLVGVAGLGLRALPERQLASSPSDSALAVPEEKPGEAEDEDRGAQSEGEAVAGTAKQKRRRLFGRSVDSSGSSKDKERSETPSDAKPSPSPTETASPRIKRRVSQDEANVVVRHARGKRSADVSKGTERHSLFGGTFTSSIGRSRKPAPRVTSTLLEESSPTEKTSTLSLSRLYSSRKSSGRPSTSEGSTLSSLRNGLRSGSEGDARKRDMERGKSTEKMRDQEKVTPKVKPTELKEVEPSRKQTGTPQDGRGGSRGPNALKPGKSIVEQIGQPDHQGWMRKKGDHYNSWKLRYFIIKGPHLYILRSNSKSETKIKGYVNIVGYKVVADENVDPGRYGFRIVHETDKTHFFSSDEQAIVREWMKAIMKATIGRDYSKPVVSSVNIPTIPLTAPRPPSPTARAATQKALRRENPNQLSTRDARILMGLPSSDHAARIDDGQESERARLESFFSNQPAETSEIGHGGANAKTAPPRPPREASSGEYATDSNLVEWANSHLPRSLQMTDPAGPLFGGLAVLRLAEDMMGKSASPPIPDSAFPSGSNDDKLDGLFRLFDFLLDNDVKMGAVSINDIRQGKRDKVMQLLRALKTWEDRRKEIVKSLGQGGGPLVGSSWK
ncbi:hypothetical protein J3R83DRAFT_1213 [Lanmaoa asiatica]|nr:hypothetical protein J3R83DRAFT_1213 [Lanmaoa asiatica]